jgi:hypothetical protein
VPNVAEIRYVGKNGKTPKPTSEQKGKEAADRRFAEARARQTEAKAQLAEMAARQRSRELTENKVFLRLNAYAFVCFKEHTRAAPTALLRLVLRTWRGKLDHLDDADKHQLRMAIDALMREWLAELEANLLRAPAEFLKEESA